MSDIATRYMRLVKKRRAFEISCPLLGRLRWKKGAWRWSVGDKDVLDDFALNSIYAALFELLPYNHAVAKLGDGYGVLWVDYMADPDRPKWSEWDSSQAWPTPLEAVLAFWEGQA